MPVRVFGAARKDFYEFPGSVALRVVGAGKDRAAILAAFAVARGRLMSFGESAPSRGSETVPPSYAEVFDTSDGPLLVCDASTGGDSGVDLVLDVVLEELARVGVDKGRLDRPPTDPVFEALDQSGNALVMRCYGGSPAVGVPADWIDGLGEWILEGDEGSLRAGFGGVAFPASASWCRHALASRSHKAVGFVAAFRDEGIYRVLKYRCSGSPLHAGSGVLHVVSLGCRPTDPHMASEEAERLKELARSFHDASYISLGVARSMSRVWANGPTRWQRERSGASAGSIEHNIEQWVTDAYPYQILSSGHRERLDASVSELRALPDGRFELELADVASQVQAPAEHWLVASWERTDGPRRPAVGLRPRCRGARTSPPEEPRDAPGSTMSVAGGQLRASNPFGLCAARAGPSGTGASRPPAQTRRADIRSGWPPSSTRQVVGGAGSDTMTPW